MENVPGKRSFLQYVKVALSVAVIRSRPAGLTGRQYAEQLFSRSQHLQLHWKNRSVELQQEVLHLKQQLIRTQTSTDGAATTCDHVQLQPDVDSMPASLPLFLTPPCSSSEHANNTAGKHQQELINHANFFQSVVALKSLSTMSSAYFSSTTLETLHRVLQMLQPWLCGSADFELSDSCAAFAVEAVTVLLSSSGLKLDCVAAISDAVLEMTQYLLKNVAEYDWSCDKSIEPGRQRRICRVIVTLLCHSSLRAKGAAIVARRLREFSDLLRCVKMQSVTLQPHAFENIYHVVWCLEKVISEEINSGSKVITDSVLANIGRLLDDTLLHISDTFPLFAQYVWHIGGLLQNLEHAS